MTTISWGLGTQSLAGFIGTSQSFASPQNKYRFYGPDGAYLEFYSGLNVIPNSGGVLTNGTPVTITQLSFNLGSGAPIVSQIQLNQVIDVYAFSQYLAANGAQAAIDHLFGDLIGPDSNAYSAAGWGITSQTFEPFGDGDGMIGGAGDDTFNIGRNIAITDVAYVRGNDDAGTPDSYTDTLNFVGAFNGTIHEVSSIETIVFDAAAQVTIETSDAGGSARQPLPGLSSIVVNDAGAKLTLKQVLANGVSWTNPVATVSGTSPALDLSLLTHDDDFADIIEVAGSHFSALIISTFGGDDLIEVNGASHVTIDGGDGVDLLIGFTQSGNTPIAFNLAAPDWSPFGFDQVSSIERVDMTTGDGADVLTGGDYDDAFTANGGGDFLSGGDGNDTLDGGEGYDTLNGGSGTDTVIYAGHWADYTFTEVGLGNYSVVKSGSLDTDSVIDVEKITFDEGTFAIGVVVNEAPVANDDTSGLPVIVRGGNLISPGNVLTNDTDDNLATPGLGETLEVTTFRTGAEAGTGTFAAGNALKGIYGTLTLDADGDYSYELDATDPDTLALPANSSVSDVFTYVIGDAHGWTDTAQLEVTVTTGPDTPVITSNGGGATASIGVNENTTAVTTVVAVDTDSPVSYAISGADAGRFTIDPATGVLAFTTAPNREAPADADHNNIYHVTVTASDGVRTDTQALSITVANVDEAPAITSNTGGATASITINENTTAVTTVIASDPDSAVSYSISGTDAGRFTINATTGKLAFVTAPNREMPTDADHNNIYQVTVTASGGTGIDTQALSITVANVNETPTISSNGSGATASITVNENMTAVTTVIANDPENTARIYSISGTDAAKFNIDAATGILTFKAAPNYEAPADAGGNNIYDVIVRASDGTLADTQALAITVADLAGAAINANGAGNKIDTATPFAGQRATGEEDSIDGKGGDDTIKGGNGDDTLIGGAGKDTLAGDTGFDRLDGGKDADRFVFSTKLDVAAVDTVVKFEHDKDTLALDDKIFKAIGSSLSVDEFYASAGAVKAHDKADRIVYNKTTGDLYYDKDGKGGAAAVHFATLANHPGSLDHGDFVIV